MVQPIVAPEDVMEEAVTPEITGAAVARGRRWWRRVSPARLDQQIHVGSTPRHVAVEQHILPIRTHRRSRYPVEAGQNDPGVLPE